MTHVMGTQITDSLIVHVDALLVDLMPEYLDRQIDNVKSMIAACGQGDYETIWTLAHGMKGCGSAYGFEAISDVGRSLERSAVEQNPLQILALTGTLSRYLEHVEVVYVDDI